MPKPRLHCAHIFVSFQDGRRPLLAYTPPPVDATESRESRRLLAVEPRCDRSADDMLWGVAGIQRVVGYTNRWAGEPRSLELVTTPNLFWKVQIRGSQLKARQQLEVYV